MTSPRAGIVAGLLVSLVCAVPGTSAEPPERHRFLIKYRLEQGPELERRIISHGGAIEERFRHIPWLAVEGTPELEETLRSLQPVVRVEQDRPVFLLGQQVDWGVRATAARPVHALGVTGQGVRVAVIDSGIATDHPDLSVEDGADFVGDNLLATPYDDCQGHGTQVAGILGARDNRRGTVGVAPGVALYAVRIFGCDDAPTVTSRVIAGLEWSIDQGMDLVNLSFGAIESNTAEAEAIAAAAEAGITIVAAAGNQGSSKKVYPAAYREVIAVGAVDMELMLAEFSTHGRWTDLVAPGVHLLTATRVGQGSFAQLLFRKMSIPALAAFGSPAGRRKGRFYHCGFALDPTDCPRAVDGNIALVQRGEAFFRDKVRNAAAAGAVGVILYNNVDGVLAATLCSETGECDDRSTFVPTVGISRAAGEDLAPLAGSRRIRLRVLENQDYLQVGGTSFAAPHVAGAAALLLASDPSLDPREIRRCLNRTARDLGRKGKDKEYANGFLDVEAAFAMCGRLPE